jgi:hypothetical protein
MRPVARDRCSTGVAPRRTSRPTGWQLARDLGDKHVYSSSPRGQTAPIEQGRPSRSNEAKIHCPVSAYRATARRAASGGRRSGAGLGDITRRRSPLRLGPAGYDRQAQFKFTRRRSTICHYGRPRPPSFGLSGPFVSSHRTRVRKASQRFVSLKAFNTEETNQRFRQRSAKVPSSNQWIITQPTPCLLRLRASKGVLSRENVNSSAVSGNTMRGAARISGARARVSCRPRLRAHPRLRYRRSQPCAMRSPFPANARQRAVLRRALP